MKRVAVVTGTRAEYGLLYTLMKLMQQDDEIDFRLIVTGMHLSPEFGLTYRKIEEDGFPIDKKVEMLLSSDTPVGIGKSIGMGVAGFADALDELKPDLMVVLGDRFEILAAVQAALVASIPVAHIAGGDVTEGAYDESIRHSITKMSHLHFVTNEQAYNRVKQLGEDEDCIYNVGSPGIDNLRNLDLMSKEDLALILDIKLENDLYLITYHPVTTEQKDSIAQCRELLMALEKEQQLSKATLLFTKANADNEGRAINREIEDFCEGKSNTFLFDSLGQLRYLSAMKHSRMVIGNSSSGLYETPSFNIPTVNIGKRQKGRLKSSSIIDCNPEKDDIFLAINRAKKEDFSNVSNPYGDGNSSQRIVDVIKQREEFTSLLQKTFYEAGR